MIVYGTIASQWYIVRRTMVPDVHATLRNSSRTYETFRRKP